MLRHSTPQTTHERIRMLAFAVIGGIGLLLLIVSMALGELVDFFDGIISTTAVGAAATLFGAAGAIVLLNNGPLFLAYSAGALLGVIGIVGVALLARKMARISNVQPHEVIGLLGVATTDINDIVGKVQLDHPDEINQRLVFSSSPIEKGTPIAVVAIVGDRIRVASTSELNGF
jgi:membrane-bound ClpP family serine protease